MFPGDEIIVAYGNRYAPDQFEGIIGVDLAPCNLVAGGGVASIEIGRRHNLRPATRITPLGLLGDRDGQRLNLSRYRVEAGSRLPRIPAILSLGTSMNAGKTLTATSMVRGFKRLGFKVAALKITGTGSGGDMWIVDDAGADLTLDFTDAGFPSTYLTSVAAIEEGCYRLLNYAAAKGCDIAVIEIADGLQQIETMQLIRSEAIKQIALGTMFAGYDAMGAIYGVDILRKLGHNVIGVSGRLGRSPLSVREAEAATGLRIYSPWELQQGVLVPTIAECAAGELAKSTARGRYLRPLAMALSGLPVDYAAGAVQTPEPGITGATPLPSGPSLVDWARVVLQEAATVVMAMGVGETVTPCNRRNGFRVHRWPTPVGIIELKVPRLRHGGYKPAFLTQAMPVEQLTLAVQSINQPEFVSALQPLVTALGGRVVAAGDLDDLAQRIVASFNFAGWSPRPADDAFPSYADMQSLDAAINENELDADLNGELGDTSEIDSDIAADDLYEDASEKGNGFSFHPEIIEERQNPRRWFGGLSHGSLSPAAVGRPRANTVGK